jgi:hypothetical protein
MFIVLTVMDSFGMGMYAGIMTFGNILLPTLGAVLIYKSIKQKTILNNEIGTIILQAVLLVSLFIFGLYIWAAGEAALLRTLTWAETKAVYNSEFSGFLPVVFTEAILIPFIDKLITRPKKVTS